MRSQRNQAPPDLTYTPNIEFQAKEFEAAIHKKGYDVTIEKAIKCPCQSKGGSPLPSCQNCHGVGWIFVNQIKTKALITSINDTTKYKAWSVENMNRINITVRPVNGLKYFDRITFTGDINEISENIYVRTSSTGKHFCFLSYRVEEILVIFKYKGDDQKLEQIDKTKYTVEDSKVIFDDGIVTENTSISFTYTFYPQYLVLDIPHQLRGSNRLDNNGNMEYFKLPIQAVAQRSHTIMDVTNFSGDGVIYNDWL